MLSSSLCFPYFLLLIYTLKCSPSIAESTPDKVSSRLEIHIPHSLFREEGYPHREALFGIPPYGGSIYQAVYYADSDLCDPNVDTRKGFPIRAKGADGRMDTWPSPYILMVDRGSCTFVQKVRNAQRSGAAAVIIADDVCLCSDGDKCAPTNPDDLCQSGEPIMADDGSGSDISIPSFLMFKKDADEVKAQVKANNIVQMEMAWNLPTPDDRVEYDLWTTPSDKVSLDFQKTFKSAATAFGTHAYFSPHMYIYDGVKSRCRGQDGQSMCYNLCTNHGRYCATDPDNDLDKGISGADVVTESLRRMCIWNHYGKEDGIGEKWWDYVTEFMLRCDNPEFFTNEKCINDVYKHADVDERIISQCMNDSGGTTEDKANTILEEQLEKAKIMGVVVIPTAYVNDSAIRGKLGFSTLFTAVCSGFAENTQPAICNSCASCGDPASCTIKKSCSDQANRAGAGGGVAKSTFYATIFALCLGFGILGFMHWRKTNENMREHVRGILAEYMPLETDDGEIGPAMDFARRTGTTEIS